MKRFQFNLFLLFLGAISGCSCIKLVPPNVGPAAVSWNDDYDYPFGGFLADAGDPNIDFGLVKPVKDAPIVWIKNVGLDIKVETKKNYCRKNWPTR